MALPSAALIVYLERPVQHDVAAATADIALSADAKVFVSPTFLPAASSLVSWYVSSALAGR